MSITAYKVEAVGHDRTGRRLWLCKYHVPLWQQAVLSPARSMFEKMEVMWADESVYGPPAPGSKVGDFIQDMADGLLGLWSIYPPGDCPAADGYLHWPETQGAGIGSKNLREKTLKNGKPRARQAKWLPEREVSTWCTSTPTTILTQENPTPTETDFFTVTRMDAWGMSTWFMCTPEAAEKLIAMDYDNLAIQETTIVG